MKTVRQPAASAADGVDRALANLFAIVADRGAEPPPTGEWGGHEVLAHLVFWHEHYVRLLRSQLGGITPALPGGTFKEPTPGWPEPICS